MKLLTILCLTTVLLAHQTDPVHAQASAAKRERAGFMWRVLDGTRQGDASCEAFTKRLEQALTRMPAADLEKFAVAWDEWWTASYRWDLWGAAYIINGGASDDGFDYFRGWLLTRGSAHWTAAARSPDTAFDDVAPGTEAECEDVIMALPTVYDARLHKEMPDEMQSEPAGKPWKEADLPTLFPHLSKRFARSQ